MRFRKGYVDTTEGQVHYRAAGEDAGPPVVFFHQTASSGAMFEAIMERLADRRRMIAFDTPGFGFSYAPDHVPAVAYYADVLTEALQNLGEPTYHLCGHHTGGCIAVDIAARTAPARTRSLILMGAVLATAEERDAYRKTFNAPFRPEPTGEYLRTAWAYLAKIGANASVELHHRELVDHLRAWRATPQAFNAVWDQDFGALYAGVGCPILNVCARDDVVWPFHQRAVAARPDAEEAVVTGMDFNCDRDPDGCVKAIADFLTRHG